MWFREHKKITAGVLTALGLALILTLSMKAGGRPSAAKGGVQSAASLITKPVVTISRGIQNGVQGILHFKELIVENRRLKDESDQLRQQIAQLKLTRQESKELQYLSRAFAYRPLKNRKLVAANVVSLDFSTWQGVVTLDRGSESGIKAGSAVVCGDGLVGKVTEVSYGTAKVASLLAENSKISFRSEDGSQTGVLQSNGKDRLIGYLLNDHGELKQGDRLVTTGMGLYPEEIGIGKVLWTGKKKGTQRVTLEAEPFVPFFSLEKVAVIV